MRKTILILAAVVASGVLFTNIYTSVVDAPNWGRDIPASIMATRDYFRVANPGTFFRVFSPINQVLTLLALIICWRAGARVRIYCALALACAIAGDVLTFAYFYPRNAIMFVGTLDPDAARTAWTEWCTMNWVRSGIVAIEIVFDFLALLRVSKE